MRICGTYGLMLVLSITVSCAQNGNAESSDLLLLGALAGTNLVATQPAETGDSRSIVLGGAEYKVTYVEKYTFYSGTGVESTVPNPYWIGSTEVTYEFWNTVYSWAIVNGYTFEHPGTMGDGSGDTDQHPVTTIDWRDATVWCNALTEYYNQEMGTNLEPVYFLDAGLTVVNRSSVRTGDCPLTDGPAPTPGNCANPYVDNDADGFRIPPSKAWGLAATFIEDSNADGDILDTNEYYPPTYGSGASDDTDNAAATAEVCWYLPNSGSSTQEVGTRPANGLGLYDMCGNVLEWNEERPASPASSRIVRGGSYANGAIIVRWGPLNYGASGHSASSAYGFRIIQFDTTGN